MYTKWIAKRKHTISLYFPENAVTVAKPDEHHPLIGSKFLFGGIEQTITWRLTNDLKRVVIFDVTTLKGDSHFKIRKVANLCEEVSIEVDRKFLLPGSFPSITPSENETDKELFIKINIQ